MLTQQSYQIFHYFHLGLIGTIMEKPTTLCWEPTRLSQGWRVDCWTCVWGRNDTSLFLLIWPTEREESVSCNHKAFASGLLTRKTWKRDGWDRTKRERDRLVLLFSFVFVLFASVAGEVPGSAVLVFDVELINVEEGLPEGYMFIWNEDVSPDLFSEMDKDDNKLVEPSEVRPDVLLSRRIKKQNGEIGWDSVFTSFTFLISIGAFRTGKTSGVTSLFLEF